MLHQTASAFCGRKLTIKPVRLMASRMMRFFMIISFDLVCCVVSEAISEVKHWPLEASLDDVLHKRSLLSVAVEECGLLLQ